MAVLKTNKGEAILVDDGDLPIVSAYSWKLRRLEQDRRAICQALGIVDDDSADLPLLAANVMAKQRRLDDLLRMVAKRVNASPAAHELRDVVGAIGQEVGP